MAYTKLWLHIIIYKDKHSSALLIDRRTELIKYLEKKGDKKGIVLVSANG
ncbi:MAG: hypothetical protein H7Y00_06345, partial [Fimbriimonadaceae bacterium]|nr:hypothetical protein [Chitinophagales bacterium]